MQIGPQILEIRKFLEFASIQCGDPGGGRRPQDSQLTFLFRLALLDEPQPVAQQTA